MRFVIPLLLLACGSPESPDTSALECTKWLELSCCGQLYNCITDNGASVITSFDGRFEWECENYGVCEPDESMWSDLHDTCKGACPS